MRCLQDNQISCFQTETNQRTHDIVQANLHRSVHIRETVKGEKKDFPLRVPELTAVRTQALAIARHLNPK